jgi:hypothetical protein
MISNHEATSEGSFPGSGGDPLALVAASFPAAIIAHGAPAQPVERFMGLQSAFSKLVVALTSFSFRRPRPSKRRLSVLRPQ